VDVTDDELLVAADGDPEAFAAFYRRHAATLLGFVARRVDNPQDAADLTAETFALALEGCHRFDPRRGDAAGWLFGIAKRQLARRAARGRVEQGALRRLGMERLVLDDDGINRVEAARSSVVAELDALPVPHAAAVRARVVHEQDYAAIAAAHGTTEALARQRVSRGLAALRRRLTPEDDR
jgi:RNA polymerase sigma-70 factor (ECF subfamily)